jgi:hypothetical protein
VIKAIQVKGELHWQQEWTASTKGETKNHFLPDKLCKSKILQMGIKFSAVVKGHGTARSYYYRFKNKDDPECM